MLARAEGPGAGHLDGDAKSVGRKGFDDCDSATVAEVTVQKSAKTDKALCGLDIEK